MIRKFYAILTSLNFTKVAVILKHIRSFVMNRKLFSFENDYFLSFMMFKIIRKHIFSKLTRVFLKKNGGGRSLFSSRYF